MGSESTIHGVDYYLLIDLCKSATIAYGVLDFVPNTRCHILGDRCN